MKQIMDFLGKPLKSYKCSRCRKEYTRLMWDKESSYTCPPCTNKKELEISIEYKGKEYREDVDMTVDVIRVTGKEKKQ